MGIKCMKGVGEPAHQCSHTLLGAGQCFPRFWQSPTISYKCMSQRALHAYREPWSEVRISRIENREAGSEDRGYWIENWESRMENWESRIGNREARIEDRGSRIENGACQARSGKLMRMADRFRTKWKFQCSNTSCCFQMILHLSFEN